MIGLAFLPYALSNHASCDQSTGFKPGDQSEFQVKYHKKRHGQKRTISYKEAEVVWDAQAMLDNPTCYDLSNAILQYSRNPNNPMIQGNSNADNGMANRTWVTASKDKSRPSSVKLQKWIVEVAPCFQYDFKIRVNGINERHAEFYESNIKSLGPTDKGVIEQSTYLPEDPIFIHAESNDTSATLKIEASPCVDSYELFTIEESAKDISDENDGDYSNGEYKKIQSTDAILLLSIPNLKPCTNYETNLQASINDRFNEGDNNYIFSTKPNEKTSENIQLDGFESGADSVTFSLQSPWEPKLACIKNYMVEICSGGKCSHSSIENITSNNPALETTKTGLTECTNYNLKITPVYKSMPINSKSFDFRTKSSNQNISCPNNTEEMNGKSILVLVASLCE